MRRVERAPRAGVTAAAEATTGNSEAESESSTPIGRSSVPRREEPEMGEWPSMMLTVKSTGWWLRLRNRCQKVGLEGERKEEEYRTAGWERWATRGEERKLNLQTRE